MMKIHIQYWFLNGLIWKKIEREREGDTHTKKAIIEVYQKTLNEQDLYY